MATAKPLKIRPYARLLTMLGEQLIKNERIALIELIKNSYDADSPWVKVIFKNFGNDFKIKTKSKIIIEDAGHGMNVETIEKHWLNPATPEKKRRKKIKDTTPKGRFIQGDKGIGRFAILKLGRAIRIITRNKMDDNEHIIKYDFSMYDDDFLSEKKNNQKNDEYEEKDIFIDDLVVSLRSRTPKIIKKQSVSLGIGKYKREPYGTRIEISDLKGSWSTNKVKMVYRDISRLESIFEDTNGDLKKKPKNSTFTVLIYKDNELQKFRERYLEKLKFLLENRAVICVEDGYYNEDKQEFQFIIDGTLQVLKLKDPKLTALNVYKAQFGVRGKVLENRGTDCGSFKFGFYLFDFSKQAPMKFQLDKEDKIIIRDHRIYLYRDGIRVYPYGEPDDDWLGIDIHRGTVGAAQFLSNEQVVGYVNITQRHNPKLKDKTNREGLIEEGNATNDFIALLRIILRYLREKPYKRYRIKLKKRSDQDIFRTEQVQNQFDKLKATVKDNKKVSDLVSMAENAYITERRYLVRRAETTEDLAGVGLSVETASHDIMAIMGKAISSIDFLIADSLHYDEIDHDELQKELQSLRGMVSFIEAQLKDIQLLFKSSKQRRRNIRVKILLDKVERIYKRLLKKEKIRLIINQQGSPLIAKTTDAVLLQLYLNLFDNAVYWLQQTSQKNKRIEILLDGNKGQMTFSDNGPGVDKDDVPYIFEPFYSGKGEEGRGLGLYIARQLLERNDYSIELAQLKSEQILSGANFVVNFVPEDK
jgi:signal transduction histidine kinase